MEKPTYRNVIIANSGSLDGKSYTERCDMEMNGMYDHGYELHRITNLVDVGRSLLTFKLRQAPIV